MVPNAIAAPSLPVPQEQLPTLLFFPKAVHADCPRSSPLTKTNNKCLIMRPVSSSKKAPDAHTVTTNQKLRDTRQQPVAHRLRHKRVRSPASLFPTLWGKHSDPQLQQHRPSTAAKTYRPGTSSRLVHGKKTFTK